MKRPFFYLVLGSALWFNTGCQEERAQLNEVRQQIADAKQEAQQLKQDAEQLKQDAQQLKELLPSDTQERLNRAAETLKETVANRPEPLDFRELRDLMPAKLGSYARKDVGGEKTAIAGFGVSKAKAEYAGTKGTITLNIVDTGGLRAVKMARAPWLYATMDKEDQNGYERTTKVAGYPAYEKYSETRKTGEAAVIVVDRFIVTATGKDVAMQNLTNALSDVKLSTLASWKEKGKTNP